MGYKPRLNAQAEYRAMIDRAMKVLSMTATHGQIPRAFALGFILSFAAASAGWAQISNAPVGTTGHAGLTKENEPKPELPAPEAVPGSRARLPVAPPTRLPTDMSPNEALFDAINRGDIASARDALNRGADLHAVNVLGMTPMELSVDLGRNDISFLLLSMRGEDAGRGSRAVEAHDTTPAGKPKKGQEVTRRGVPAKPVPVATRPVATPKLFANDGGAPQPNAGFLGFDPRGATN